MVAVPFAREGRVRGVAEVPVEVVVGRVERVAVVVFVTFENVGRTPDTKSATGGSVDDATLWTVPEQVFEKRPTRRPDERLSGWP